MKTLMFAVFDSKAAVFGTPFFMPREAMAIRSFTDIVNDKSSTLGQHPEDFTLYHLADFEDDTGITEPFKPRALVTAASLVKPAGVVAPEKSIV